MCQETAESMVAKLADVVDRARRLGPFRDGSVLVCVGGQWYSVDPELFAIPSRRVAAVGLAAGVGSLPELSPAEGRPRTALSDSIGEPWP